MPFSPNTVAFLVFFFFMVIVIMTVFCIVLFFRSLHKEDVRIESYWGGLGGGQSGWIFSRPLVYLVLAITFAMLTALMAGGRFINSTERLKEKYSPIYRLLVQENAEITHYDVRDRRIFIQASVRDKPTFDDIWKTFKLINPALDDIEAQITIQPAGKTK